MYSMAKRFYCRDQEVLTSSRKAGTWRRTLKNTNKNRRKRGVNRLLTIAEVSADNREIKIEI